MPEEGKRAHWLELDPLGGRDCLLNPSPLYPEQEPVVADISTLWADASGKQAVNRGGSNRWQRGRAAVRADETVLSERVPGARDAF